MICEGGLLKSRIETRSLSEEIITSSIEVVNDSKSDMAVGIRRLGNPTGATAENNVIAQQNAGSQILTLEIQTKNQIYETLHSYL